MNLSKIKLCKNYDITYQVINFTLINVSTNFPRFIDLVSRVTDTPVHPYHVLTGAILADVGILRALVDVVTVVGHPSAMRTQQVELSGAGHGARLAIRPPAHWLAEDNGTTAAT